MSKFQIQYMLLKILIIHIYPTCMKMESPSLPTVYASTSICFLIDQQTYKNFYDLESSN